MLSNKLTPILGACVLLAIFVIFSKDDTSYIKEYEDRIDVLELVVDSLKSKNDGLHLEVLKLEKKSDSLDTKIEDIEQQRKNIIRSYEIYLQQINDLDDSDLEQWILSRYNNRTRISSSTIRN